MIAAQIHDLGDERDLRFTTTISGVNTDPDELIFSIKEPDGVVTDFVKGTDLEVEKIADGIWRVLWICRKAGSHYARVQVSGNINQAEELLFYVRRSAVIGTELPPESP